MKTKELQDFLKEDSSLIEQITYEEYKHNKSALNNVEDGIADAYKSYRTVLETDGKQ